MNATQTTLNFKPCAKTKGMTALYQVNGRGRWIADHELARTVGQGTFEVFENGVKVGSVKIVGRAVIATA